MSYAPPPSGQPPSFKTNVNRAKTKRWVEAKSYSYDGDDWGDMDEYDEYGGYDEPPPPPRPTGLRQQGQSASKDQPGNYQPRQGAYNNPEASQHGYGNLGRQGLMQQQYGGRSATNPQYQTQLARSGSFDQGDERRAFSATYPHHGTPPPHNGTYYPSGAPVPQRQPGPPVAQPAANVHDLNFQRAKAHHHPADNSAELSSNHPLPPKMGSRTQSMTSNSSTDFHNRRDFSPSAVPPPLHTKGPPSPHHTPDSQLATRPPRKSSLGQYNQTQQPYQNQDAGVFEDLDPEGRGSFSRERTDSDPGKALPFVRPADIYKRMQEEKERERQSQESSRPSMDAITGNNGIREEPGRDLGGVSDRGQDAVTRQRSRSTLDSVAERSSEHGMPGAPQVSTRPEDEATPQQASTNQPLEVTEPNKVKDSLSPQLPDVARMSGFGELFTGTSSPIQGLSATSAPNTTSQSTSHQSAESQSPGPLQHQPSLGFRSVVHQAFDINDSVPETPSSSSIGRSGSGGTSVVSPIISRGPSSATPNLDFRAPQIRPATPPPLGQSADSEARPQSSGSLDTPKATARKASLDSVNHRPATFMPGHRRDLSTPSPDNSPARTPALEANKQLQQPQEAELAMTTPIDTQFPYHHSQSESSQSSRTSPVKSSDPSDFATMHPSRIGHFQVEANVSPQAMPGDTPRSPAGSNRSRVRNLADKFESSRSSPTGSERAPSPVKTSFLPSQATNQSRPLVANRLESFRPKLPGGWESSVSLAPLAPANKSEPTSAPVPLQQRLQNAARGVSPSKTARSDSRDSRSQVPDRGGPAHVLNEDDGHGIDPFASLAAAGSALAGAFSSAMGTDNDVEDKHSPTRSTDETDQQQSDPMAAITDSGKSRPRNASVNTALVPEASKPMLLATPDDGVSSIMPTPLDKLAQPAQSRESKAGDYFSAGLTPKQQTSSDSYTSQGTASTKRSELLPSISTESQPQYESDRLRREIIRELSPRVSSEPSTAAESDYQSRYSSRQTTDPNATRVDSMVIPREYDSYWNDPASGQSSRTSSVKGPSKAVRDAMAQYHQGQSTTSPVAEKASSLPPVGGKEGPAQDQMAERPEMPGHRFSWEGPHEVIPPVNAHLPSEMPTSENKGGGQPAHALHGDMSRGISHDSDQGSPHVPSPEAGHDGPSLPSEKMPVDRPMDPNPMRYSSDLETAAVPNETDPNRANEYSAPSIARESAVHDYGPVDSRAESYPHQSLPNEQDRNHDPPQPRVSMSDAAALPALPAGQPKIHNFRDILAMKEPLDRIQAYNESREAFANTDTGLAHWLAVTITDLPEHKDILPHGRLLGPTDYKPSTARSKLGALLPGSSLNAGSATSGPNAGQMPSANSPQGFSPSSGNTKLSSQQMQARGKDLLHTAGVFGGKANVAAKGLFSKGKSRFRGGNADKAPISSFNVRDREGTQQQQHQQQHDESSKSSPNTPPNGAFSEQAYAPQQSISSRPNSLVVPSEQNTPETSFRGEPNMSQQSHLPAGQSGAGDTNPTALLSEPDQRHPRGRSPSSGQASSRNISPPGTAARATNQVDSFGKTSMDSDPIDQGRERYDQSRGTQSPDAPSSTNRTPTQADYTDYLRHGSSPTAQIPQEKQTSNEAAQESLPQLQPNNPDSKPLPQSKYSIQAQWGEPSDGGHPITPDQDGAWADQPAFPRASQDTVGTFQTAESGRRRSSGTGATSSHPSAFGAPPVRPVEDTAKARASKTLSSSPQAAASPEADIREESRARPFSFVRFSQSPALRPLEDYSRRQPSIDSTAGKIDPSEDVPPSPLSSGHSVAHTQIDHSDNRDPVEGNTGAEALPHNGQNPSSRDSQLFPQPHQTSSFQDHPPFGRGDSGSLTKAGNLPVEHYPASIPRQELVSPRQEEAEHSLEGVGPAPIPRPRNSTSNSKRGSRSSAFFRSFKSTPNDTSSPQLSTENDVPNEAQNQENNRMHKTKSKRGSLFRSLTGGKANSGEASAGEPSYGAQSAVVQNDPKPAVEAVQKAEDPAMGPSKYRNRLSRTATAKMEEQQGKEPSKKNRFSAIGSLFGRSRDQRARKAGIEPSQPNAQETRRPETEGLQKQSSQVSSSKKAGRGDELPSQTGDHHKSTRDKLARQGFLKQEPVRKPSKPAGPSVTNANSTQEQPSFPPRHQSLGYGSQQSSQPSGQGLPDWSREHSSNSMDTRSQQSAASIAQQQSLPVQQHRVQSSVTTRSTIRQSGPPQSYSNPRQFSSTTTTTTTTSRNPNLNPMSRQQQQLPQGSSYSRSDSPPPPPPPPKDTWHQSKSHQRSLSNESSTLASGASRDTPPQGFNFDVEKDDQYHLKPHHRSTSKNSFTEPLGNSYGTPTHAYDTPRGPPPPLNSPQTTITASPHLHPYGPSPQPSGAFNVSKGTSPPLSPPQATYTTSPHLHPYHPSPPPSRVFNVPKGPPAPLKSPQTASTNSPHLHPYQPNPQPSRVFNVPKSSFATSPPQHTNATNAPPLPNHSRSASVQSRQSLPPLQTTMAGPSLPPSPPRGTRSGTSGPDAMESRQSQIESLGTPRAEEGLASPSVHPTRTTTSTITSGNGGVGNAHTGPQRDSHGRSTEDEPIVMSATSFPGQEWQPSYGWEGD
ncbi:MAG: hypothetical protein Q9184_003042 [Pyrenodesmia sp. 2 TL-2023]